MTSKTKYIVIVLLLLVLATTSVGLSTWNIHYQAIVGDIDFTATEPGTQDSVLNRYIYFTPAKDADGNITTIKQSYPIGRGGAEDIFTYIYDAKTHTPTVFVPSKEDIKGSDSYPTDLFLADGALNLDWGIEDVFDEIEFKYEYRLIAMPFVADYKGKSDNYCEVHSVTYGADTNNDNISDSITVCISWKNGKGNHNGENVTVVLGVDGTFTVYDQNSVEIANPKIKASIKDSKATIGVDGFNYYNFSMESNGWTETVPSNAGVYQCRITAVVNDAVDTSSDTNEHKNAANEAIEALNALQEDGINYAAQVTYAILPAQVEQATPTASYSDTTQTFSTRRLNTANAPTSSQSETVDYQDDTNGSFSFNEGAIVGTSFVYKGQNYNISITSNVQISNDLTFSVDYAFDQEKNAQDITEHSSIESSHIYTTYGFSSNPNYVVINPEAYYCIIKQEVKITGWTGLTTTYNGEVQEPIVTLQNHRGETIDAEHGEIKAVLSYSYNGNAVTETKNAGVYTVAVSLADAVDGSGYSSQNYKLVNAYAPDGQTPDKDNLEVDFTIQKAPLTVTANAHKITYGDALSNNGVSYSGFIGGDNENNSIFGDLQITSDYDKTNATKRIVGSYTLTPSGYEDNDTAGNPIYANDGHHNYTYTYATGTLTVEKLVVAINWTNLSFTFDGTEHKPTATVNNKPYEDDTIDITIGFDGTTTEAINAGTYTAKATGLTGDDAGNYTLEGTATLTKDFTISPKDISSANITITSSLTYNGSEQTVAYTVTITLANDTIATLGSADFTATGDKATNAYDNPTLTLIGKGNYCSTITQTWKIAQREIGIDWTNTSFTYDGKSHKPTATATGIVDGDTINITIGLDGTATEAINAGTYTAKATGLTGDKAGNYKLPANATKTFTIEKAPNEITSLTIDGWTYGQTANKPNIEATYTTGVIYTYSADGNTFTSAVPTNAGAYTIKAEIPESTNYLSATATATFTIEKAENKITSLTVENWTFGQTASTPVIVATYAENVVYTYSTAQDGEYTATVPTNAGTYYIKAEIPESDNYLAATATTTTFTINKAPNEITSLTIANWTFGQTASIPVIVATYAENVVYTYSADGNTFTSAVPTNAGTYTIKAEIPESTNYLSATAKTATFTINKAPNAIVWSDDSLTADKTALVGWTYGSTPVIHTATDSFGTSLQVVYYTTYNATTGECSGEFTPSSTTSAGTYYAKAVSQDYGSNHHGMPSVMSFAVTEPSIENATVELSTTTLTYNGAEQTVDVTVTLPSGTVLNSANYTVTYTLVDSETGLTSIKNAGTYTVTITGINQYQGEVVATEQIVVAKAQLTVKANDMSIPYGSVVPTTCAVTYTGFVNGENENTAGIFGDTTLTFDWDGYQQGKNADTRWDIMPGGLESTNYEITFEKGRLSITKQAISLIDTDNVLEFSYGETGATNIIANARANVKISYGTVANVVSITYTDGSKTYDVNSTTYETISIGNTYQIDYTISDTKNYEWATDSATSCYYKYKTAKIGGTYYTVEDAIKTGGNIVLAAGKTSFTSLDYYKSFEDASAYYTIASGSNFFVPHSASASYDGTDTQDKLYSLDGTGNLYATLLIPTNVDSLTIDGSLGVGGSMAQAGKVGARGVIMNETTIILNGKIHSIGYIKSATGNGQIIANNKAIILDVLTAYDYKGGSNTLATNDKIFPFNAYSVHNISCDTIIYPGASYSAKFYVEISVIGSVIQDVPIVGANSLFTLSSGFVKKSVKNAINATSAQQSYLTTEGGSNQTAGQKDIVTICGVATDNSIRITKQAMGYGIDIITGPDYPLPISFMDIHIGDENHTGELNLNSVSYNFLAGTKLVVSKNGTLTVAESITIYFYTAEQCTLDFGSKFVYTNDGTTNTGSYRFVNPYDRTKQFCVDLVDSELVVNGTATINGHIGGTITTQDKAGIITIANTTAKVEYLKTLSYKKQIIGGSSEATTDFSTYNAVGPMVDNAIGSTFTTRNFDSGTYYSTGNAWYKSANSAIKYYLNDGSGTYTEQSFTNGDKVTLSTPTRTGYTFTGWIDDEGNTYAGGSEHTLYANLTLTAQWSINSYTVTFVDEDGTTVLSTETIEFGAKYGPYIPEITPKDGQLLSWQIVETGDTITADTFLTFDSNHTIKAVWKSGTTLTVKFETTGGSTISDMSVIEGEAIKLPTSTREHYDLVGWFTEETGGTNVGVAGASYAPTENVTLYAQWTATIYTVEFNANGGTCSTPSDTGSAESAITLPTPTLEHYTFNGWYTAASGGTKVGDAGGSYTPQSNITLYAQWTAKTYTVTYNANGGSCTTDSAPYTYGSDPIKLPTPTRDGYTFNGWYTAASGGTKVGAAGESYTPTADITLYAQWTQNSSGGDGCFAPGTLITMADGTTKRVEDLVYGDLVLVFNHDTGQLDASAIIFNAHKDEPASIKDVLNLHFSNGNTLRIVAHHGLFDCTLNEYVEISIANVAEYIGHEFFSVSSEDGKFAHEKVVLTDYTITHEFIKVYSPITADQINCFGEGILTAPGLYNRLMNIFELDENMKVDAELKQADIDKYGLYEYAVFEEYVSYEIYRAFNGQYFKVAVEKGLITLEEIIDIILDFNIKNSTGIT